MTTEKERWRSELRAELLSHIHRPPDYRALAAVLVPPTAGFTAPVVPPALRSATPPIDALRNKVFAPSLNTQHLSSSRNLAPHLTSLILRGSMDPHQRIQTVSKVIREMVDFPVGIAEVGKSVMPGVKNAKDIVTISVGVAELFPNSPAFIPILAMAKSTKIKDIVGTTHNVLDTTTESKKLTPTQLAANVMFEFVKVIPHVVRGTQPQIAVGISVLMVAGNLIPRLAGKRGFDEMATAESAAFLKKQWPRVRQVLARIIKKARKKADKEADEDDAVPALQERAENRFLYRNGSTPHAFPSPRDWEGWLSYANQIAGRLQEILPEDDKNECDEIEPPDGGPEHAPTGKAYAVHAGAEEYNPSIEDDPIEKKFSQLGNASSGLKWEDIGSADGTEPEQPPTTGEVEELRRRLEGDNLEFSQVEWTALQITDLTMAHVVNAGGRRFVPAASSEIHRESGDICISALKATALYICLVEWHMCYPLSELHWIRVPIPFDGPAPTGRDFTCVLKHKLEKVGDDVWGRETLEFTLEEWQKAKRLPAYEEYGLGLNDFIRSGLSYFQPDMSYESADLPAP